MFDTKNRALQVEKINGYFQAIERKLPMAIGYGNKLTCALFDCFTKKTQDKRTYNEKQKALMKLISSKYDNLIEIFDGDGYKALEFFFEEKASVFQKMWIRSFDYSYQDGYLRRPFRTKIGIEPYFDKNMGLFVDYVRMTALEINPIDFFNNPFTDDPYIYSFSNSAAMSGLLSYEIDNGNKEIRELMKTTINENTGNLCATIILAIVKSNSGWAHELLGNLLLTAKLQEGLRQTIVEAMDGGNTHTFIYLLKLIIDNNLERFSSVIRAFDVWTGLPVSAEKPATVRYYLNFIYSCVTAGKIDVCSNKDNPLECYLALLCKGFFEVEDGIKAAQLLINDAVPAKRAVAYYWLSQLQIPHIQLTIAWNHIDETDPFVLAFMLSNMFPTESTSLDYKKLFYDLKSVLLKLPIKKTKYSFPGMPALQAELSYDNALRCMNRCAELSLDTQQYDTLCDYVDKMSADLRYSFITLFVKNSTTAKQRKTILMLASDKSSYVRKSALEALQSFQLTREEYLSLEVMLRFKTEDLRKNIMSLLLSQKPDDCLDTVSRLMRSEEPNCQLAATQFVREMKTHKEFQSVIAKAESLTSKEAESRTASTEIPQTAENGMGLYRTTDITAICDPEVLTGIQLKDAFPDFTDLLTKIKQLSSLVEKNRNFEYEIENWDSAKISVIFGTVDYLRPVYGTEKKAAYAYPLAEVFVPAIESLFPELELDKTIFAISLTPECNMHSDFDKTTEKLYGICNLTTSLNEISAVPYFRSHIRPYLEAVYYHPEKEYSFDFYYRIANKVYHSIQASYMKNIIKDAETVRVYMRNSDEFAYREWYGAKQAVSFWMFRLLRTSYNDEQFKKCFALELAYTKALVYKTDMYLPLEHLARAYDLKILNTSDVMFFFTQPGLSQLMHSSTGKEEHILKIQKRYPKFFDIVTVIVDHIISIETLRGELPSSLSAAAGKIGHCYGIKHFVNIICAMEKRNYVRGYNFAGQNSTKGETLSYLMKNLYPAENDNAAMLNMLLCNQKVKPQQLIDAAMYAPQWLGIVENHLKIPGLKKMGVYFHAHLNEFFDGEKQAMVARYSSISPNDFKSGAFDLDWFKSAYEEIGESHFKMVYTAAKYIAGGNLHNRSRLFSDAALGRLDKDGMKSRAAEKRNRDCLLAYTLIPIANDADSLERYLYLEQFKKESKQYGALRQQSESRACVIGIDNLARNAGYTDANRFIWQMETKKLEDIIKWFSPITLEDITLQVAVNEDGFASLVAEKENKKLASIPAKYKKNALVIEGSAVVKSLREQFKRAKITFENAMVNRDAFLASELDLLMTNPVLAPILGKILFFTENAIGFWSNGAVINVNGERTTVSEPIMMAHPYDFLRYGQWAEWQLYFCQNQIKQPFKQVFREYYAPTQDELAEKTISRRYAGHQIMPKKAAALASSRGWYATEGMFKVFYKENIMVEVFSGFTWFSPADIEPPVIENVRFIDNKTGMPYEIEKLPSVLFSETMRDIDLIVSVAHFGGIDPEASLSTIDMRKALFVALLPLLKLDNVKVEGTHALIKGQFGEYSVHLGSGVAHMQAKGMIPIVPVHSGQRGRIFLPFADDDPKTAEIISKIVLLAEDNKMKDPNILKFIRG